MPGPRLYAATGLFYYYYLSRGDFHRVLKSLHDKYGPAVRYSPTDVSFNDYDAMRKIYGHRVGGERTFEKDRMFYSRGRPHSNIINANSEDHKRMRRLLAHAFSEKALLAQEGVMKHYIDKFIERLTEKADPEAVLDMVRWFNFTTFDLIGDLAFGEPFNCLEDGGYHPWVKMIFEGIKELVMKQIARRMGFEKLSAVFTSEHLKRSAAEHWALSQQTAMKRLQSKDTERPDFISYVLRYNDERAMSVPEIAENSSTLVIAGSETTATLLSVTTFQLLTNTDKLQKLIAEIRGAFKSEDEIDFHSVSRLEYLLAVLNEGLRMRKSSALVEK